MDDPFVYWITNLWAVCSNIGQLFSKPTGEQERLFQERLFLSFLFVSLNIYFHFHNVKDLKIYWIQLSVCFYTVVIWNTWLTFISKLRIMPWANLDVQMFYAWLELTLNYFIYSERGFTLFVSFTSYFVGYLSLLMLQPCYISSWWYFIDVKF